ncbi:SIS domain-containing protein [Synechococcus sp. PROS-U-1]|uniref:SIS domain-containing protein n=1 Tax=Synechococcus sp. PROS-U-1 TaxID=1400866 RepID=UPI0016442050|nr:SIS domain-containing protein [Synechococcus sp. PROS-U-1]QNJ01745.1 D-sedoheptulose 7-phosphate isomerase [Synechococcus sp. PROS-U-1]
MNDFRNFSSEYLNALNNSFNEQILDSIYFLCSSLAGAWSNNQNVFLCGNGGSAANAIHIANDLLYGVANYGSIEKKFGLKVESLTANSGILTCLANDTGYENIFSKQLEVKGSKNDVLIALSGSGNSKNIITAIHTANKIGIKTFAILGYDGGICKSIANHTIHFAVDDMQIAEDVQLIVGHLCMKYLNKI